MSLNLPVEGCWCRKSEFLNEFLTDTFRFWHRANWISKRISKWIPYLYRGHIGSLPAWGWNSTVWKVFPRRLKAFHHPGPWPLPAHLLLRLSLTSLSPFQASTASFRSLCGHSPIYAKSLQNKAFFDPFWRQCNIPARTQPFNRPRMSHKSKANVTFRFIPNQPYQPP